MPPTPDEITRARLRFRRQANRVTFVVCIVAAIVAIALGIWLGSLAE
jgi:ABC-type dipeptide/oligopeptide/nickel transport system permease component